MALSAYAQKSTSVKVFEYPDYLCPNPYTGEPIYGGSTLEISYSNKNSFYGIEFWYGYIKYSLSLSYKGMDNGRYVYTGFEIGNMTKTVVMTSVKLSRFLNNYGQIQNERFEKDKLIEVHINGIGSLSIYPVKETSEKRKEMKEKETDNSLKDTSKNYEKIDVRKNESTARDKLNKLYRYGMKCVWDSLQNQVIKEFFENGGIVKSFDLGRYSSHTYVAVIDTNKQVTIIRKDEVILNDELQNEQLNGKVEYEPFSMEGKSVKIINGKVFFSMTFHPQLEIQEYKAVVIFNKKGFSYFKNYDPYYVALSTRFEPSEDMKKKIEASITKKGEYSLYWSILNDRLVYLSYKRMGTAIFKAYEPVKVYSIYK